MTRYVSTYLLRLKPLEPLEPLVRSFDAWLGAELTKIQRSAQQPELRGEDNFN